MPPPAIAPARPARMQIGFMSVRWGAAFPDLMKTGGPNFTRPGTEAAIGPADCSPEGWPNAADFNVGLLGGGGFGLPVDPLVTGRVRISFRGDTTGGANVAGNASDLRYAAYDPVTDTTTGSFVITPNGANYVRMEFRGASFRDADGTRKPGIRDLRVLRPRTPGSLTAVYAGTEGFADEFLGYVGHYDFFRYYQPGSGAKEWADRTPPYWWNQGSGRGEGPAYETMIALANRARRNIMACFPAGISEDYMRQFARLIAFGSDASGTPYTSAVPDPYHPPLDPDLWIMLEGGLEPWNFSVPYIIDQINYANQVVAHHDADDEAWAALNYDGVNTNGFGNPSVLNNEGMGDLTQRMRVYQLNRFAAMVREVAPGALHNQIRLLYSPQLTGMVPALRWHEMWFQRLDPRSTYSGPIRTVADDIWGSGGQAYWSFSNADGLTDLIAAPTFASPDVGAGYNPRPAGGPWTFAGPAGIATTGGDVPPAYGGDQVGYVCGGGSATISWTVPPGGNLGTWDVLVKCLGRQGDPNGGRLKVYLDRGTSGERDITPQSDQQRNGVVTPRLYGQVRDRDAATWPARRVDYTDSNYYSSPRLEGMVPGATHAITFEVAGTADDCVFLGEVRVGWTEAITASDFPTARNTPQRWLADQSFDGYRAAMFGVAYGHYESAPDFGGDDGGSDKQQWARYKSPGVRAGQLHVYQIQADLGCCYLAQGAYEPVPDFGDPIGIQGYASPDDFSIVQAVNDARRGLTPALAGRSIPGTLTFDDQVWSDRSSPSARYLNRLGQLVDWRLLVDDPGIYRFEVSQVQFDQGSSAHLILDGRRLATGGASFQAEAPVHAGAHSLRLQLVAGSMGEQSVTATRIADLPDDAGTRRRVILFRR